MSEHKPTPPNYVPEEDLNLHENFAPIIAPNGLIRQPRAPQQSQADPESVFLTQVDTLQDLIEIRRAEKEKTLPPQPLPQELTQATQQPPEHTFAILQEQRPQVDLTPQETGKKATHPLPPAQKTLHKTFRSRKFLSGISAAFKGKQRTPATTLGKEPEENAKPLPKAEKLNTLPPARLPENEPVKKNKEQPSQDISATLPALVPALNTALVAADTANPLKEISNSQPSGVLPSQADTQLPPPSVPPEGPKPSGRRWWPWVLLVVCVLFLGGITGVMPVEKIPLLRNLAYAMGFSKDDTARMSFLRALLSWTDKHIGLPGDWSITPANSTTLYAGERTGGATDEGEDASSNAAEISSSKTRYDGQSSLINMRALQQLQREKGRALDAVRGAVMVAPGREEAQVGPAQLRDDRVVVRTESTRVQADVYFGEDAGAVSRNAQDGFDSSKTLTKIKNPHISDGKPIDWLSNMAQKMVRATTSLAGIDRELNNTQVNWATNMQDVDDNKEHRDLYHAWITSRMSKYTSNNMLKKALADSSFLGADLPQTASNVLGFGGVQIDTDSFGEDQEAWKEYLEFEKRCKEDLRSGGGLQVDNAIKTFNSKFHTKGGTHPNLNYQVGFPQNCVQAENESYQEYEKNLDAIGSACHDAQVGYSSLGKTCLMDVRFLGKEGQCDNGVISGLKERRSAFKDACKECDNKTEENEKGETVKVDPVKCRAEVTSAWHDVIAGTEEVVLDQIGGDTDYFPQIVKDQDTEEEQHYGKHTIVDGMKKNANITDK